MIKKIGLVKNTRIPQGQKSSKKVTIFCGMAVLAALLMAGCQKDNSTSTTPQASISTNLTSSTDVDAKPVYLGTAVNFTILSETGISTTGVTAITGNIGVSPIAGTAITGFGLKMDASNQFSTTPIVTGEVFAANYAPPTPAKMTTAISDMKTAFTKANGRTFPAPLTEKFAGDLSGRTLHPGLYKWGTGVLISGVGVKLSGLADDVWVFQIAKNLTVSNGAIITLEGGAQAKNIFWVVSGKATLGTAVNFKGNILSKTLISVNTGSKVTGRLLAQTAVTLIADDVYPY
ncbi:ice-binding family protein [uncultured Mucilaginibacter sp.]|uniref:ice-binding family protein n=1 Tax=uncultured Mucilaginibacter sp. TaxID=797541 RepID=UPI0025DAF096|nr:ice-binding family protein [uncultured Mucilaginibacter sp.]